MAAKKEDKAVTEPDGDEEVQDGEEAEEEAEKDEKEEKEPEKPKETEEDAPNDTRPQLTAAEAAVFHSEDLTLNAMVTVGGKLLTALSDGGMQYLVAGARASLGVKAGRYLYEVKIAETRSPSEPAGAKAQSPKPRQLLRIGFASSESSLLLPTLGESACFDSEGNFYHGLERKRIFRKFGQDQKVAVLLNLEPASPNANTISLFVDGVRACEPQQLPEALKGKALYPALTYRNVTLQVNFGPHQLKPLPFSCRSINAAAKADVEIKPAAVPAGGKYEVVFPVGLPDEGTFDWLDQFLETHKNYTEISDRAILEWASKSGIQRPKGYGWRSCNDKPDMGFGLPLMDDASISRAIMAVVPVLQKNFVFMEVKGNLVPEDRTAALARFPSCDFKKTAKIAMGEPPAEYKTWVQEQIMNDKKAKALAEVKKRKAELTRKKLEEERKKKAEAAKKAREEAAKKAKDKKAAGEESAKEAAKETAEAEKDEEKENEGASEVADMPVDEVALTEEEKTQSFRKKDIPDLTAKDMALHFSKFSIPEASEGFDGVEFLWQSVDSCKEYLRQWMLAKKLTERVEDLQPSEWFKTKWSEWTKLLSAWKKKQQELKDPAAKKKLATKKKAEESEKTEGADEDKDKDAKMDVNADDLDVFSVEDVMDIGNGEPLFAHYVYEDWALLSLRFELHLLVHAFRHDLADAERPTFHQSHLGFYYNKYYKKQFSIKYFGVSKLEDLVDMMKDTVEISSKNSCLEAQLSDDTPMDNFVKLTEDHRRDRLRRLDAGDETAQLKFTKPAPAAPPRASAGQGSSNLKSAAQASASAYTGKRPYPSSPASYGAPRTQPRTGSYGAPSARYSSGGYGGGGAYSSGGGSAYSSRSYGGGYGSGSYGSAYRR